MTLPLELISGVTSMYTQPHTDDIHPVKLTSSCTNIRHKLMFVDARHAGRGKVDTQSDTRVYWCAATQDHLGRDGEPVDPVTCSKATRSCYCGS